MKRYKISFIAFIMFIISLNSNIFAEDFIDDGSFISSKYLSVDGYKFEIKKRGTYKTVDYTSICIEKKYSKYNFGYFAIDGNSPFFIKKIGRNDNIIVLECCGMDPYYTGTLDFYVENYSSNLVSIGLEILDNDEIIIDSNDILNKKEHFYRISGPAKIPEKKAVINDSNIRLRVKPNLYCDIWTKLQKGTEGKIKDKSLEPYKIDGESWYWYKIDIENMPDGWVYGKYLDIQE